MFVERAFGGSFEAWTISWMRRLMSSSRSTGAMAHDGLGVPGCESFDEDNNGDYGREWTRQVGARDASRSEWRRLGDVGCGATVLSGRLLEVGAQLQTWWHQWCYYYRAQALTYSVRTVPNCRSLAGLEPALWDTHNFTSSQREQEGAPTPHQYVTFRQPWQHDS